MSHPSVQGKREIDCRLAAELQQDAVGVFPQQNFSDAL